MLTPRNGTPCSAGVSLPRCGRRLPAGPPARARPRPTARPPHQPGLQAHEAGTGCPNSITLAAELCRRHAMHANSVSVPRHAHGGQTTGQAGGTKYGLLSRLALALAHARWNEGSSRYRCAAHTAAAVACAQPHKSGPASFVCARSDMGHGQPGQAGGAAAGRRPWPYLDGLPSQSSGLGTCGRPATAAACATSACTSMWLLRPLLLPIVRRSRMALLLLRRGRPQR